MSYNDDYKDWEPRLRRRNVYGYLGKPTGRGNVTTIWNPYKHRIIMETHFLFGRDIDFYYFEKPIPFYSLYLYQDTIIQSHWHLMNIARMLLKLNPDLSYNYFASLMYELIHPSYPYLDHSKLTYNPNRYDKILKEVYNNRQDPRPIRYKKFFFNPNIEWYENEKIRIAKQVASPMFGVEDGMDAVLRDIARDRGRIKDQHIADMYSCGLSTIRKIFSLNPHLREYKKRLNAQYDERLREEKEQRKRERELERQKKSKKKVAPRLKTHRSLGKAVRDYWKTKRKIITKSKLKEESRKLGLKIRVAEIDYNQEYFVAKLKQSEQYKKYMLNVRGIDLDAENI